MAGQVDEIKARIDIVDLVSEYIKLKPAGTNNHRALCPFHNEKSPSFMVSKDKQIFHCFGCSEGGDIFTFVEKMEGVEFTEALKILAQKAGIKLVAQDPKMASQKTRLLDITKLVVRFYHKVLLESSQAKKARDYLAKRQVSQEMIEQFQLGYAVESWDAVFNFLKEKKFTNEEIFLAGLTIKKDRGLGFYDRFRDRLMFPINDLHGSPIGFSARALNPDEKGGKYINTPQTLIYNKSLAIFNLDKARQEIKQKDLVIVVEGQMDALSSYQAGVQNVIASSGTALTVDQLKILKRYTNNLAMAFDADSAGQAAAKRGIDLALQDEMEVKVIVIPDGKDPDECIKKNPADWIKAIEDAKSVLQYYFDETFAKVDLSSSLGKKEAAKILLPVIAKMGSKIEQTHWLQKLANRLNVSEQILREALPSKTTRRSQPIPATAPDKKKFQQPDRNYLLHQNIIALVLTYPLHLPYLIDNLPTEVIIDNDLGTLYKKVIIYYTENIKQNISDFNYQDYKSYIDNRELGALADKLVLLAEKDFFDFDTTAIEKELDQAIGFSKKNFLMAKLQKIEQDIKQAENSEESAKVTKLSEEFNQVLVQLNTLK